MLNADYLLFGLNAVSRAHSLNYFEDGHRGGAIISAVYLCKESPVGDGVPQVLGRLIDKHWTHTDLCAPFPDEDAQPGLRQRILDTLARNTDGLRQAGHNVILPTLALKAFTDVPEAITESRVEGICRLIESFTISDVPDSDPVELESDISRNQERSIHERSGAKAKPLQKQYWVEQKGDWNLGHVVKYPYGFYGILGYVQDRALVDRCMTEVYRIF